jgi:magnesium-transporting ATPase (P-type)
VEHHGNPALHLFIGPISSIFDYTTFAVMLWVFKCWDPSHASLFQTGWFVESLMTQTLIIHVIRTNKIPFLQSRASSPLMFTTLIIMAFGMWLPYSPLALALGLTPPAPYVLADPDAHAPELYGNNADHQSVVAAEASDLDLKGACLP